MFRQGDILFVRVQYEAPIHGTLIERQKGRLIVAEGEVTGHAHAIATPTVQMYDKQNIRWLVAPEEFVVEHDEHEALTLPPGVWRVVYQREYSPQRIGRVLD